MTDPIHTTAPEWLGWPSREAWEAYKQERHLEWITEKRAFLMRAWVRGYATMADVEACND